MSTITTETHWDKRENNKSKRFVSWPIETKWWSWWRILILTKRKASQYPVGHDRPVLVSCNGCSPASTNVFPPPRPTASPALLGPLKPISTLSSKRPLWCHQTPCRLAVGLHLSAWLSHSTRVFQWKWVGCCWGRRLHSGIQQNV